MTSDENDIKRLCDALATFAPLKGLVIDVRGNGGGSRDILRALFPYVMRLDDKPRVANVGAYRVPPGEERGNSEGYLQNRFMYPRTASVWRAEHKKPLFELEQRFEPDWKLPKDQFSAWHYLVLDRADSAGAFFYDKPVVILMDAGCFSATDIFLGAFKGWRNVTLLGTASGGGSGRSRGYTLHHSGIDLKLSSMASFRPNGQRYDGQGIEPDVVVRPHVDDLAPGSQSDAQLDAALKLVRK